MTETRHKHALPRDVWPEARPRVPAAPPRRKAQAGPPWFRTGRAVLGLVVVVAVAVVASLVAGGSEDPSEASGTPGLVAPGEGIDWITEDGSAYRMTVRPSVEPVGTASPSGCVQVPARGTTNLRFVVEVVNRTPTRAEVPELEFAANLAESGAVDTEPVAFSEASKQIEMTPVVGTRTCADSSRVGPIGRVRIDSGASVAFTGTIAGVREPIGDGLAVIIRYAEADAGSATGSTTTVVRVPFAGFAGS